jgi:uncharacterized protein YdaU (DUF1376 family)
VEDEPVIKPRKYDLNPGDFLSDVAGEMTPAELGVYWMICLLQYRHRGPIKNDMAWLRRKFTPGKGLRLVAPIVEKLIGSGRLVREGDEIWSRRVREEVEKATRRVRDAAESGSRGGRPPMQTNGLEKGSGFPSRARASTTTTTLEEEVETLPFSPPFSDSKNPKHTYGVKSGISHRVCVKDFERFWEAYPHRGGFADPKKPASAKFAIRVKGGADPEDIIAGAERYAEHVLGQDLDPRYIPQAVKWLNDQRWEEVKPNGYDHGQQSEIDPAEEERRRHEALQRVLAAAGIPLT